MLAVPGEQVPLALSGGLHDWGGRTLVDATNHVMLPSPPLPGQLSSSELVAELAEGAKLVKALNTLVASVLASDPEPYPGIRRLLFVCGDDVPSKETFRALLEQIGYATIDLGGDSPRDRGSSSSRAVRSPRSVCFETIGRDRWACGPARRRVPAACALGPSTRCRRGVG